MSLSSSAFFRSLLCFAPIVSSLGGCEVLPGTPTEASAICAEIARTVCEADARCFGPHAGGSAGATVAECERAQRMECDATIGALASDPRLGYDPAHAGALLVSLDEGAQSCWQTPPDVDALVAVFQGSGVEGADCTPPTPSSGDLLVSSLSCRDGLACRIQLRIDGSTEGVCRRRNDDTCSHPWDCEAGMYCSLPADWQPGIWGQCRPRRVDGWECASDLECASLFCDGHCGSASDERLSLEVPYSALVMASRPAMYLRLNESSGARHDEIGEVSAAASGGTVSRVASGAIHGDSDGAAGLAGGSFLRAPAPEVLADDEALSLECWARPDEVSAVQPILELADAMDYGPHVWAYDAGDEIYANFRDAELGAHTISSEPGTLAAGEWHHVVASYDGAHGVLYLDGRVIGTTDVTGPLRVEGDLLVGHRNAYGDAEALSFTGAIDEVAVYGHALSADDVVRHHDAGVNGPLENTFPLFAWTR